MTTPISRLPDAVMGRILYFLERPEAAAGTNRKFSTTYLTNAHEQNHAYYLKKKGSFLGRIIQALPVKPGESQGKKMLEASSLATREIIERRGLISLADWNTIVGETPLSHLSFHQLEQLGERIQYRLNQDLILFFDRLAPFQPKIAELDQTVLQSDSYHNLAARLAASELSDREITQELNRFKVTEKAALFREFLKSDEATGLCSSVQTIAPNFFHTENQISIPPEILFLDNLMIYFLGLACHKSLYLRDYGFIKHCLRSERLNNRLSQPPALVPESPFTRDNHRVLAHVIDWLHEFPSLGNHPGLSTREMFQIFKAWPEFQNIQFQHFYFRDRINFDEALDNTAGHLCWLFELMELPNAEQIPASQMVALRRYLKKNDPYNRYQSRLRNLENRILLRLFHQYKWSAATVAVPLIVWTVQRSLTSFES